MDVKFMQIMYHDYNELRDKYINKEFDGLIEDFAECKATLRLLQSMLVHEFTSIDAKFDPLILCDEHEKWKTVIQMLLMRANNQSSISKRNR